jgi:hypothetical protein
MSAAVLSTVTAPDHLLPAPTERRAARRIPGHGDVWLVNHFGRTILRCHCVNSSPSGLRLHVPPGYGIAAGQRYEYTGQMPGEEFAPALPPHKSRWGTIVWSRRSREHGAPYVDVGVEFDG